MKVKNRVIHKKKRCMGGKEGEHMIIMNVKDKTVSVT